MKYYKKIKNVIILLLFSIIGITIIFLMNTNNKKNPNDINIYSSDINESDEATINIQQLVADIKKENFMLEYETQNIQEFVSLTFSENGKYKSYIIDTLTGKYLEFKDLIKKNMWNLYLKKELELLRLKYPEFIVESLLENNAAKFYYIKDNELIIFYYDYNLDYEYNEDLSLKIDYNEIKDYLNFKPILNSIYEIENGYVYVSDKKSIALTFDDGPSYVYNSKILDLLAKNKAHATFFMVGQMMYSCQKCVLDTYNSGNEIGAHTYEHINIKNSSVAKVNESLYKTNDIYKTITNDDIKLLRPPYGAYDKENLENIKNPFILWNMDTEDWRYRNIDKIVDYIMANVSDGSIILMHELYATSYEALKILLPKLYVQGYQVVSVSELANLKNITLKNGVVYTSFK